MNPPKVGDVAISKMEPPFFEAEEKLESASHLA